MITKIITRLAAIFLHAEAQMYQLEVMHDGKSNNIIHGKSQIQVGITGMRGGSGNIANTQQHNPRFNQAYRQETSMNTAVKNNEPRSRSLNTRPKTFPTPVYPNRMDFCFYHRVFGKDARNHELPCAWKFPPNNK